MNQPATSAHIGLGSNIEPERNLPAAVALLAGTEGVRLEAVSPVYRTPPWGFAHQADFLNAVARVGTTLRPPALLERLLEIERLLHRERGIPNGPRTADLDLLLHGETVLESDRLTLPHPRMHQRGFVLVPLADLAPDLRHPVLGLSVARLLEGVERDGITPHPLSLVPSPAGGPAPPG